MAGILRTALIFLTLFHVSLSKNFGKIVPVDDPYSLLKVGDTCEQLTQVQSTVIEMLGTHYEYGKGIHKLHEIMEIQQGDLLSLKQVTGTMEDALYKLPQNLGVKMDSDDPKAKKSGHGEKMDDAIKGLQTLLQGLNDHLTNVTSQLKIQVLNLHRLKRKLHRIDRLNKQRANIKRTKSSNTVLSQSQQRAGQIQNEESYLVSELSARVKWLEDSLGHFLHSKKDCPRGFYWHMQSCYMFVNTTATWRQAEELCQHIDNRAHLVSVETQEENDFILKYRLYNNANWTSKWLWTGGHDREEEGVWTWVGTGQKVTFNFWLNDDLTGPVHDHEDCMYYMWEGGYRWDDWSCDEAKLNFVCEIQLSDLDSHNRQSQEKP